jgi:hypothetical protein
VLPFDPSCESSLAVFEQLVRSLPSGGFPLPEPMAPNPEVYQAWMERYEGWKIPTLYSELIQKYGGVREAFPPMFRSIEPIADLLRYRVSRDAIREKFSSKFILLSPSHIDGKLCLMFHTGIESPPVAFFCHDDNIVIEADTLGMYLWSVYFFLNCIRALPSRTTFSLKCDAVAVFLRRIIQARFVVYGSDSRRICAIRDRLSIFCWMNGDEINITIATTSVFDDLNALKREFQDMIAFSTG